MPDQIVLEQPARILLTGAAGFIGFHTACLLEKLGHTVVAIDNLNDAYDTRLKQWRWAQLERLHPKIHLHRLDITDRDAVHKLMFANGRERPFDAIINLAARAGVRASVENPRVYVETNIVGWLNLMEEGREFGVRQYVLASTSSLYGKDNPMPYQEDQSSDKPLSPYAATKKAAEAMAHSYHYLHGLDITILRFFTVYGPACRPDMAPFRFVQRIVEGQPITLYGDGSQSRDFTFSGDIAAGVTAALDLNPDLEARRLPGYRIINLGSDHPVKVSEFIEIIERLTGQKAIIERKKGHPADMYATWADIHRAQKELSWRPKITLEEGLQALIDWYMANRSWARDVITD